MGVIAAQLGHADTRMTERHYAHLSPSYVADTVREALPPLGIGAMSKRRAAEKSAPKIGAIATRMARVAPEKPVQHRPGLPCAPRKTVQRERYRDVPQKIPQGWLPVSEAISRIVRHRFGPSAGAKERDKAEEAWRSVCESASEGRIRAAVFTEDGKSIKADLEQFIALQERYLLNAGTQGHWLEDERRYLELRVEPERKFLDTHGRSVFGVLLFSENDLETAFHAQEQSPPRKTPEQVLKALIARGVRPGQQSGWSWKDVHKYIFGQVGDPVPRGCSQQNIWRLRVDQWQTLVVMSERTSPPSSRIICQISPFQVEQVNKLMNSMT